MSKKISIPTIEQIKNVLDSFSKAKLSNLNFSDVAKHVKSLDRIFIDKLGFIFRTVRDSNTDQLTSKVYRVRKKGPEVNTSLIPEFSHPPPNLTTTQRVNLPGYPIFYCSPNAGTSLLESLIKTFNKEQINEYYLSEWEFVPGLPAYTTIFLYGQYDQIDFFNSVSEKNFKDFAQKIDDLTGNEEERLRFFFKQISSVFEQKDDHYLSSYLGHIHFYDKSNIRTDVMVYPSIELGKGSLNYAVHPNAVFHKMRLKRVFEFKVNSFSLSVDTMKAEIDFRINDILGINNNHGYLIWRNLPEEDHADFQKLFPQKNI